MQNNSNLTTAEDNTKWFIIVKPTRISFITHSDGDAISNTDIEIPVNEWHHFAFVRKSNQLTIYVNGVEFASGSMTEHYGQSGIAIGSHSHQAGNYPNSLAFVQDIRISTKAVYSGCFDSPTSLSNLFGTPASNPGCSEVLLSIQSDTADSIEILDNSTQSHKITKNGTIPHSLDVAILGQSSLYFDGNKANYLSLPYDSSWNLGGDDFTIEFWVNSKDSSSNPISILNNSKNVQDESLSWGWMVHYHEGKISLYYSPNGVSGTDAKNSWRSTGEVQVPSLNEWHHIAFVRSGLNVTTFIDGCEMREIVIGDTTIYNPNQPLIIGRGDDASDTGIPVTKAFHGYLQDIRISKKAVYTGGFEVPNKLHESLLSEPNNPICSDVELSIQSNTTNESDNILDISIQNHEITKNGNVKHSASKPLISDSSIYFDGNGDYLSVGDTSTFKYLHDGTADYTVECWVNFKQFTTESSVIVATGNCSTDHGLRIQRIRNWYF